MAKTKTKLTAKQKDFADQLIADPKKPAVKAALQSYGKPDKAITYRTANAIAVENLQKPAIMAYLEKHAIDAEHTLLEVMKESQSRIEESPGYAAVAVTAAKDILDRVHGKATQKTETTSKVVTINIDLTKSV